nr:unnamed protein product [Sorex araneus]
MDDSKKKANQQPPKLSLRAQRQPSNALGGLECTPWVRPLRKPCFRLVVGGKVKKPGKRGRKPAKIDLKAKLERSRQSARECRARKKLRYQYLEELVSSRETAICGLREELEMYKQWCVAMDQGKIPSEIQTLLVLDEPPKPQQSASRHAKAGKTDAHGSCEVKSVDGDGPGIQARPQFLWPASGRDGAAGSLTLLLGSSTHSSRQSPGVPHAENRRLLGLPARP